MRVGLRLCKPFDKDFWIETFEELYGNRAAVRSQTDQTSNMEAMARHCGLSLVNLPANLAELLLELEGKEGKKLINIQDYIKDATKMAVIIPENELTEYEAYVRNHVGKYFNVLNELEKDGTFENIDVKIFDYPKNWDGPTCSGFAGYGSDININRSVINGDINEMINDVGHVFFHEAGHVKTGADDSEQAFRNTFTRWLAKMAEAQIPMNREELSKQSKEWVRTSVTESEQILAKMEAEIMKANSQESNREKDGG